MVHSLRGRRRRRGVVTALVTAMAAAALGALPGPAQAVTPGPVWEPAGSECTENPLLSWWGGVYGFESPASWHAYGTMYMCRYRYRAIEVHDSPDGDYYAMVVQTKWTPSSTWTDAPAAFYQEISSDIQSIDNVYDATNTVTSTKPCNDAMSIAVGVNLGAFSLGTEIKMCDNAKVQRYYFTKSSAGWFSNTAGAMRQVETAYIQKVPQGTVPCFTTELGIPQYDTVYTGTEFISTSHLVWGTWGDRWCDDGSHGPRDTPGDDGSGGGGGGSNPDEPAMVYDFGNAYAKIYRWRSDGSTFGRLSDYTSGPYHLSQVGDRVASGDVDGDGRDDVVMAYQQPDGTFSFYVFSAGITGRGRWYDSGPYSLGPVGGRLVVADFTGDGKAEPALVRDNGDGTMKIYRWKSTGSSFTRLTDYQSGAFHLSNVGDRVAAGDVTGDGIADIVMAYQQPDGTFSFYVFKSGVTGLGRWYDSGPFGLGPVAGRIVVADFTGDGKAEPALVRDNGDGTMRIYRWKSTGSSFTRLTDYQSGAFHLSAVGDRVAAGDVTGDGIADIVMAYQNSDGTSTLHVFRSGASWAGRWYTGGQYNLSNVDGRLVVGNWY